MKYLKLVTTGFLMSMLFACSSDDDANDTSDGNGNTFEISDEPFSGTIDDENFTLAAANGEITFEGFEDGADVENDGVEKLRFALSSTDFDCGVDFASERFDIEATVITEELGIQNTSITTVTATGIITQARGMAEIVSINETEAEIKILTSGADLDANYNLEGLFTVTICPEPQISVAP